MCSMCSLACCRQFWCAVVNTVLHRFKTLCTMKWVWGPRMNVNVIYGDVILLSCASEVYAHFFHVSLPKLAVCWWVRVHECAMICGCEEQGKRKKNKCMSYRVKICIRVAWFWLWFTFLAHSHFCEQVAAFEWEKNRNYSRCISFTPKHCLFGNCSTNEFEVLQEVAMKPYSELTPPWISPSMQDYPSEKSHLIKCEFNTL